MKNFTKYFLSLICLAIFFYILALYRVERVDYFNEEIFPAKWKGIIENKEIYKFDKDQPIIYFMSEDSLIKLSLVSIFDYKFGFEIYNFIQVGDSILKDKNSGIMKIKRRNEVKEYNLGSSPNPYKNNPSQ